MGLIPSLSSHTSLHQPHHLTLQGVPSELHPKEDWHTQSYTRGVSIYPPLCISLQYPAIILIQDSDSVITSCIIVWRLPIPWYSCCCIMVWRLPIPLWLFDWMNIRECCRPPRHENNDFYEHNHDCIHGSYLRSPTQVMWLHDHLHDCNEWVVCEWMSGWWWCMTSQEIAQQTKYSRWEVKWIHVQWIQSAMPWTAKWKLAVSCPVSFVGNSCMPVLVKQEQVRYLKHSM